MGDEFYDDDDLRYPVCVCRCELSEECELVPANGTAICDACKAKAWAGDSRHGHVPYQRGAPNMPSARGR